jgi:hypothetical protein
LAMARIPTSSGRYRTRPAHLAADKAYSSKAFRAELRRRRIKAVIPQRSDQQRRHKGRPWYWTRCITAGAAIAVLRLA